MFHTNIIVPPFSISSYALGKSLNKSCTGHNTVTIIYIFMNFRGMCIRSRRVTYNYGYSVTIRDIFMKLYRNVYHTIMITFHLPFQSYDPLIVLYAFV